MTSNNSIYKMIREHLRHNMWMLGLSAIGSFLFGPIIFLFSYGGTDFERYRLNHPYAQYAEYVNSQIIMDLDYCGAASMFIACVGAAIVGFGIFSYLFNSRKIDLYHSLPVTRKEMFWSGYLTGLFIWLIPFLAGALLSFISAFIAMEGTPLLSSVLWSMGKYLFYPAFGFFVIYHLCLLATMLSGNIANAMVSTCVWGLSAIALYGILIIYADAFYDTYYDPATNYIWAYAFSPLATPLALINLTGRMDPDFFVLLVVGLIIAGINLLLAYRIHKVRKSELAGHGMDNKIASLSIKVCICLIIGLLGMTPLYIFGYNIQTRPLWMLFFNTLFTVIAFVITSAIQKRSVKGLFSHKLQLVVITLCTLLISSNYCFDFSSYDSYLPAKGDIESMEIDINGFDQYTYYGQNFEGYKVTDTDVIHAILETAVNTNSYTNTFPVTVKVSPKFGFDYYRRYQMSAEDIDVLRPVVENEEYMSYRLKELLQKVDEISSVQVYAAQSTHYVDTEEYVAEIIDAYISDSYKLLTFEEQGEYLVLGELAFRSYVQDYNNSYYNYISEVPITPAHTNTIKAILKADDRICLDHSQFEVTSLVVSRYTYQEFDLLNSLYKDLLPADMIKMDKEFALEHGANVSDNLKAEAVVIQTAPTVEYVGGNDYMYTFVGEELEWLLPYLHYANSYHDNFGFDTYAHLGHAYIQYNDQVDVYIKRGDLSPEDIQKLASYIEKGKLKY